jgi:hypothetical protein
MEMEALRSMRTLSQRVQCLLVVSLILVVAEILGMLERHDLGWPICKASLGDFLLE